MWAKLTFNDKSYSISIDSQYIVGKGLEYDGMIRGHDKKFKGDSQEDIVNQMKKYLGECVD